MVLRCPCGVAAAVGGYAAPGSVVYPAAAGDGLPGAVIDPGHGGGEVPVPDVAAQADAGLIEHGNAVEGAEPLPQHQHRGIEGPEDQGQQGVARLHGQLMLEGKGRLRRMAVVPGLPDGLRRPEQGSNVLLRGAGDDPRRRQLVQGVPDLQNGADLLVAQAAPVIGHNGFQGVQGPGPAIVRDEGAHPGPDL